VPSAKPSQAKTRGLGCCRYIPQCSLDGSCVELVRVAAERPLGRQQDVGVVLRCKVDGAMERLDVACHIGNDRDLGQGDAHLRASEGPHIDFGALV
jgi:hypothetical protein